MCTGDNIKVRNETVADLMSFYPKVCEEKVFWAKLLIISDKPASGVGTIFHSICTACIHDYT